MVVVEEAPFDEEDSSCEEVEEAERYYQMFFWSRTYYGAFYHDLGVYLYYQTYYGYVAYDGGYACLYYQTYYGCDFLMNCTIFACDCDPYHETLTAILSEICSFDGVCLLTRD